MSHVATSTRAMPGLLTRLSSRHCARCYATSAMQPKQVRPSLPQAPMQSRQPIIQRRTKYKTIEQARSRYSTGPFSWKSGILFVATCAGLMWYFEFEKERMNRKRVADASKGVGRPKVGGHFELVDQNGKPFSSEMMKGKYSLVSRPSLFFSLLLTVY
jgi:protein SCO1/2